MGKISGKGAMGVVARDAYGLFLGCSVITIEGVMDPATLESMASDFNLNYRFGTSLNISRLVWFSTPLCVSRCISIINREINA